MYAIISDGGRQYKVQEGQVVDLDYRNAANGSELKFEQVLAYSDGTKLQWGAPVLSGASVTAEVVTPVQGPKVIIQWFRRRKNSRRRNGHRQLYTQVKINKISLG